MRNLVYLILLVFMSACANNSQCADKKMRRFTFAAFNTTSDTSLIKSIKSDSELQQVLEKSGVVNYNFCTMDSISYLILDMNENFNLDKTKSTFESLAKDYPQTEIFNEIVSGKYMLLDRIYKMEQNNSYSSSQGQLIPLHKDKYAFCFNA